MSSDTFRIECDSMGELRVPAEVCYGASTVRAVESFSVSGCGIPRRMIRALGLVKWAAARVNGELLFEAARYPKSFLAVHLADHLMLRRPEDASWVGRMVASWFDGLS